MSAASRIPRRGALPLGLLGALALILAVERHVARHDLDYLGGIHWTYRVAGWNSAKKVKDCKVLCFGDSLLKMGFAPQVVEARTGLKAHNLAIPGGPAPVSYYLLKKALAAGSRPSAVVIDHFPCLLADEGKQNRENYPFLLNLRECFELAWAYRDAGLFADLACRKALPSVRARAAIRTNIQGALMGQGNFVRGEVLRVLRNWEANRGAEILTSRPGPPGDLETWFRGYFPQVACRPINQVYIDRFMELADAHGIQVFWLLPPYQPALQARCEQSGFDADHEAFVRSMLARFPRLRVIDGRRSNYDPKVFVDPHHLGREGASNYTTEVADLLGQHLGVPGPRWIAMPAYRERPMTVPIEDGETSRLIVIQQSLKRRR